MKQMYVLPAFLLSCFTACGENAPKEPLKENSQSAVPEGYSLVWADEFEATPNGLPGSEWWFETGNHGWGNNEPQNYVDRVLGTDTVAKVQNGMLTITAFKLTTPYQGSDIISARMNTTRSWKYGYFEMRAKLPGGKGTWAAFWMLPEDFKNWPLDGEIDIMEYVGYRPDVTQASVHCQTYNHAEGNGKTDTRSAPGAERKFYAYGLLWTEDEITAYIDGIKYFTYPNDHRNDKGTWPFNVPFYLKLNLAIGGNWGGQEGIDPTIFPSKYEIDYVRVYQK
jgi:beta-glucanase (GH16 family)